MTQEEEFNNIHFLMKEKVDENHFVYRPPKDQDFETNSATVGVKFSRGVRFLDPLGFMLIGKSRWERVWFRLLHPIAYAKRAWNRLYLRIRNLFIKDRMGPCILTRRWVSREELLTYEQMGQDPSEMP